MGFGHNVEYFGNGAIFEKSEKKSTWGISRGGIDCRGLFLNRMGGNRGKKRTMASKTQFIVDNYFVNFYTNQNLKKKTPGNCRELSKTGVRIVLRKTIAPGKSEQNIRVFW